MDAFSKALQADKREIVIAPTIYKFDDFKGFAEEFKLGERDCVLTNEFIYKPFMEELGLKCNFVFQEKFGGGEPSEAMIETMYEAIPYDILRPRHRSRRRRHHGPVQAAGLQASRIPSTSCTSSASPLYMRRKLSPSRPPAAPVPKCTNISVAIVKDEKDGKLTGGDTKLGLVSDDIIPNKVCLVPDLLKTLPYKPFACFCYRRSDSRNRVLPDPRIVRPPPPRCSP